VADDPTAIRWPVVFVDGLHVELYESSEDIALSFEPWMAEKPFGTVFDSIGRVLRLETKDDRVKPSQSQSRTPRPPRGDWLA
jgi:hypothetical protein